MTNSPAARPASSLALGKVRYKQSELLDSLTSPWVGDVSMVLARQLTAAKLNLLAGVPSGSIAATVTGADTLLATFKGQRSYKVAPSSATGAQMADRPRQLEQFNTELLPPDAARPRPAPPPQPPWPR